MSRVTTKIPSLYRKVFFIVLATSWTSGILFFILNTFITREGEFGPEKVSWQFDVLKIHGAAAFLMMIAFGALALPHVTSAWKTRKHRRSGIPLFALWIFMILTGYLLYYSGSDTLRTIIGYIHAGSGLIFPAVLAAHILRRKRGGKTLKSEA